MPLNCPQNGKHLRFSPPGGKPLHRPDRGHGKAVVIVIELLVALGLIAAGAYAFFYSTAVTVEKPPVTASAPAHDNERAGRTQQPIAQAEPVKPAPKPFCQRDFSATKARQNDIAKIKAAGGLIHLLAREQAEPPFKCAAFYLAQGLKINAVGPNGLTPLHYAIKANKPKMVKFVITHGANLHKKAGKKQLEPMSYAYYLAFNNPETNRNPIIAILNDSLVAETQSTSR